MSATVQLERSAEPDAASSKGVRLRITVSICLVLLALGLFWWTRFGRDLIVKTVHPYRVTYIDISRGTMSLVHGNRRYVVRCAEHCTDFKASGFYRLNDAGSVLEYSGSGQTISLPIVEEETTFDVTGGHG